MTAPTTDRRCDRCLEIRPLRPGAHYCDECRELACELQAEASNRRRRKANGRPPSVGAHCPVCYDLPHRRPGLRCVCGGLRASEPPLHAVDYAGIRGDGPVFPARVTR